MNKIRAAYQNRAEHYLDARDGAVTKASWNLLIVILLVALHVATLGYFVPIWVASHRRVPNVGSVAVIDIFLGWTIAGWAVALAMACRSVPAGAP
jgi:hypothetical protein